MERTYGKLRELIRKKFGTIRNFAEASGIKEHTLQRKLIGRSDWKTSEIENIVKILGISPVEINEYFFY